MIELADCSPVSKDSSIAFFQIGGGIAGDFPICVVPMLNQDVVSMPVPEWGYFCQSAIPPPVSDHTPARCRMRKSHGETERRHPRFVIESDATIVAPLVFAKVLGW